MKKLRGESVPGCVREKGKRGDLPHGCSLCGDGSWEKGESGRQVETKKSETKKLQEKDSSKKHRKGLAEGRGDKEQDRIRMSEKNESGVAKPFSRRK